MLSFCDSVHRQVVSHLSTETFKLGLTSDTGSHRRTTSLSSLFLDCFALLPLQRKPDQGGGAEAEGLLDTESKAAK